MSEDPVFRLWRHNIELAEKVTQLELLKNHWYQELFAERRRVKQLKLRIDALKAEMQAKDDAFETMVQARLDALEDERIERIAIECLGLARNRNDRRQ